MIDVVLPQWGMGMSEGIVVRWLRRLGDIVAAGDDLVEIETEKVTSIVVAPVGGRLDQLLWNEGDVVAVHEALARIVPSDTTGGC